MNLENIIQDILALNHKGKHRPLSLDKLLKTLHEMGEIEKIDLNTERHVRKAISRKDEICNAGFGYYLARERDHKEDVEESIKYLLFTYQKPLNDKVSRKKMAYPQYYPDFDPNQMELFGGGQ